MATHFLTAEATGGNVAVALPNGARPYDFEIHSIYAEYVTVGPPTGARQVRITLESPAGQILAITGGDTQPVNTTRFYMAFYRAPLERVTNGDDIQWCPWPPAVVVEPGSIIRVRNVSGVATGSDIARIRVQYDTAKGNLRGD